MVRRLLNRGIPEMTKRVGWAAIAALAGVLAACSGEVVGGGQKPVETRAVGDGGTASSSSVAGTAPDRGARYSTSFASAAAAGTVDFDARVTLVDESHGQERAVIGTATAQVGIAQHDSVLVAREQVAAVPYVRARVAFTRVHANVTGGLVIGGVNLTGAVDVPIAQYDSVVVERDVAMTDRTRPYVLVVDLNAGAWLPAASTATRLVPDSVFASAVRLRAHAQ
jgi:hypothetical protein